jgi:hypothetical protein
MASGKNLKDLLIFVNNEFYKIVSYFRAHKLALHPDKTKFMIFSNSMESKDDNLHVLINFNNLNTVPNPALITPIERITPKSKTPAIKFLGVYFDPNLDFKFHISTISSKISKALYIMRKSKNLLPQSALKSLYYSLFHSQLIYCIQIWTCTSQSNTKPLLIKQKIAIRILHQAKYNAHTESLFKMSKILPLNMLTDYFKLQFIHRYVFNHLPASFVGTWVTNEEQRRRTSDAAPNLRPLPNSNDFYTPPSRLISTERQPLSSFAKLWNEFTDVAIKSQPNKFTFNKSLKNLGGLQVVSVTLFPFSLSPVSTYTYCISYSPLF